MVETGKITDTEKPRREASTGIDLILDQALKLARKFRRRQDEIARKRGITLLQYSAIQVLRREGPLTVTELAGRLHLKHSTVSKLVDRMERDRLAVRVQSSEDRRASRLRLTELALERVEGLTLSAADFAGRVIARLTPKEQAQLMAIALKLAAGFKKELERLPS